MPDFVEIILVQLSHEAGKVAVFEVFGQDMFGEFLVLGVQVSRQSRLRSGML
jgi:hypothetical protein